MRRQAACVLVHHKVVLRDIDNKLFEWVPLALQCIYNMLTVGRDRIQNAILPGLSQLG